MLTTLFIAIVLAAPPDEGWTDLVGNDLTQHWNTAGKWKLDEEGVVALNQRGGKWKRFDDYLWSKKTYGDFEITFEYKLNTAGRSGFFLRVSDVKNPIFKGINVNIVDSARRPKVATLTDHDNGGVFPRLGPKKNPARPAGEWNSFQVTCKDDILTIVVNGETVNEINLATLDVKPSAKTGYPKDQAKVGYIGFQDHARPVWFRNIRIRELSE